MVIASNNNSYIMQFEFCVFLWFWVRFLPTCNCSSKCVMIECCNTSCSISPIQPYYWRPYSETGLVLGLRPANEMPLLCNDVSHWLGTNLESALWKLSFEQLFDQYISSLNWIIKLIGVLIWNFFLGRLSYTQTLYLVLQSMFRNFNFFHKIWIESFFTFCCSPSVSCFFSPCRELLFK